MKIYIVRHGQTDLNKERRAQGRKGLPLNGTGIEQARATAEKLKNIKFDYVFSSPQKRALQTAEIISKQQPIIDERLDVFDLGSADCKKMDEIKTILNGLLPDPDVYTGVEDVDHYVGRVYSFMAELTKKFKNKDVNILISGHKCTTGCVSAYFEGMPEDGNFLTLSTGNAEFKLFDDGRLRHEK